MHLPPILYKTELIHCMGQFPPWQESRSLGGKRVSRQNQWSLTRQSINFSSWIPLRSVTIFLMHLHASHKSHWKMICRWCVPLAGNSWKLCLTAALWILQLDLMPHWKGALLASTFFCRCFRKFLSRCFWIRWFRELISAVQLAKLAVKKWFEICSWQIFKLKMKFVSYSCK